MQPLRLKTRIQRGSGYGYITFPWNAMDAPETVLVQVTINGVSYTESAGALHTGQYLLVFNREALGDMHVRYGQEVEVEIERRDEPPQLNDLPADLLCALQEYGVEEDFKRLSPEDQKETLRWILEAETADERACRVESFAQTLRREDAEMPRGESL